MIVMFRFARILSASTLVGPFAPSTMIEALMSRAFFSLIWFSRAAGNSTLTGKDQNSSVLMVRRPSSWYPLSAFPLLWAYCMAFSTLMPAGL
jgi:hypothetical protein